MVELTPDGREATSGASSNGSARVTSLHSNIEQVVRGEMQRISALERGEPATLRADLRSICADAKRLGMRAELLVIAIKKVWQEIPEARSFARPREMDSLLNDVVTMTLDEFYRTSVALRALDD